MTNQEFANGLRMIADFYEKPENVYFPQPYFGGMSAWYAFPGGRADLARNAVLLAHGGKVTKGVDATSYTINRDFGSVTLQLWCNRKDICEIVGYEDVQKTTQRVVTPAVTEDVTEVQKVPIWHCPDSLLEQAMNAEEASV